MAALSGIVKDSAGVPCANLVRAYRRDTGAYVGEAVSDPTTGLFSIPTFDTSQHIVVRIDAPATPGDPQWSKLAFAMHMAGTNGSTSFPEEFGAAVTPTGAVISNAHTLFGANTAYFNGSSNYLTVTGNAAFNLGTADFTIRCWLYQLSVPALHHGIIETRPSANYSPWIFGIVPSGGVGKLDFYYGGGSTTRVTSATTVPLNAWTHLEVTRSSGVVRLFIDGVLDSVTATVAGAIDSGSANPTIGKIADGAFMNAYLADLQIYKGVALHTASFTPPTTAYLTSATIGSPTGAAQVFDAVVPV